MLQFLLTQISKLKSTVSDVAGKLSGKVTSYHIVGNTSVTFTATNNYQFFIINDGDGLYVVKLNSTGDPVVIDIGSAAHDFTVTNGGVAKKMTITLATASRQADIMSGQAFSKD